MSDEPSGELGALKREWLLARIILLLGVVLPIGLYFWLGISSDVVPSPAATDQQAEAPPEPVHREDEAVVQGMRLCKAAVTLAKNFGVVPLAAQASGPAGTSETVGRYLCRTSPGAETYVLAVDLECRNLSDERCLSLFSVTRQNGQVLFQRQG